MMLLLTLSLGLFYFLAIKSIAPMNSNGEAAIDDQIKIVLQADSETAGLGILGGVLLQNLQVVNIDSVGKNQVVIELVFNKGDLQKQLFVELAGGFGLSVGKKDQGNFAVESISDKISKDDFVDIHFEYIPLGSEIYEQEYREYLVRKINENSEELGYLVDSLDNGFGDIHLKESDIEVLLENDVITFSKRMFRVVSIRLLDPR